MYGQAHPANLSGVCCKIPCRVPPGTSYGQKPMDITGNTRLIAHVGYPTHTFKAPLIYNPYFESAGIDVVVVPFASRPDGYPALLHSLFTAENVVGALVTMPHKVTTCGLLDRISPTARIAGACNAVRRAPDGLLEGDMFDGEGFVRSLRTRGIDPAGRAALVAGCGGVGSAIAASLAAAGTARLALHDIDAHAVRQLAARLKHHYPALVVEEGNDDPAGFDVVVNATSLGMKADDPMPLDVARISPDTFVGEVVLKAEITPFLAAVKARGCRYQVGTDMLFEQIPAYLSYFGLPTTDAATLRRLARISY